MEISMMVKIVCLVGLLCLLTSSCSRPSALPSGQWVDLSYELSAETLYWPTAAPFRLDTIARGRTQQGYYYSAYQFCAAEHGGTHLDAPIHFAEGRHTVDQIPLTQLIAPVVKIDVSQQVAKNRDYQISVTDLTRWEAEYGQIPEGSIVLLETGYGRYWPDAGQYLGTDKRGTEGVAALHFPGLDPQAAQWLVQHRRIKAIGIDTASIDYGQSQNFASHVILLEHNIPALENVAHLDKLPTLGAQLIALPLKIKGGSGGPVRIIALLPSRNR
jgi:kynurenine formamidase